MSSTPEVHERSALIVRQSESEYGVYEWTDGTPDHDWGGYVVRPIHHDECFRPWTPAPYRYGDCLRVYKTRRGAEKMADTMNMGQAHK